MRLSILSAAAAVLLASTPAFGDAKETPAYERQGKAFLKARFSGDTKALESMYGKEILLLPGHEYLKKTYGINPSGDRAVEKTVTRKQMIELDAKLAERLDEKKRKQLVGHLDKMIYTFTVSKGGSVKIDPSDPVQTQDGKLTLQTREGDVMMKVQPKPKADFLLLVLRREGERWKVVMDYTD